MSKPTIIIVEDEQSIVQHLRRILLNQGYTVPAVVVSGEQALQAVEQYQPDLVLMDILLKGEMGGLSAGRKIHKNYNVPVVYLTGDANQEIVEQAQKTDPYGFIYKPIQPEVVRAVVELALYKHKTQSRIRHLNQVLRSIRNVNQLITHEKDPAALIQKSCDSLIETSGYNSAWISLWDDRQQYQTSAAAGLGQQYPALQKLLQKNKLPACGKKAIQHKKLVITDDPKKECPGCPLSSAYGNQGAYTIQLATNGKTLGLFSVAIPKSFCNDKQEQDLFIELAEDISFALHNIELEAEQQRSEQALRKSKEYLQTILDTTGDGFWVVNTDGKIEQVNQAYLNMTGYTRSEILKLGINDIDTVENPETTAAHIKRVIKKGAERFETQHRCKDGHIIDVDMSVTCLDTDGGKFICFGKDITERKKYQEALKKERDRLELITNTSPIGITIVDREGKITFANQYAERVLGLQKNQITQRTYNDPEWEITDYDGKTFPDDQLPFKQVQDTGKPVFGVQHAIEWPSGKRCLLSINAAPLFNMQKQFDGMVSILQDVTEYKRMERELRHSEAKFRSIYEESPIGIELYDSKGELVDVNSACLDIFGVSDEAQIKGFKLFEDPNLSAENKKRLRKGKAIRYEVPFDFEKVKKLKLYDTNKSGIIYLSVRITPLKKAREKSALGYLVQLINITERKQAEQRIKEKMARIETLNRHMVGRELKMVELKKEVNQLLEQLGEPKKFPV